MGIVVLLAQPWDGMVPPKGIVGVGIPSGLPGRGADPERAGNWG